MKRIFFQLPIIGISMIALIGFALLLNTLSSASTISSPTLQETPQVAASPASTVVEATATHLLPSATFDPMPTLLPVSPTVIPTTTPIPHVGQPQPTPIATIPSPFPGSGVITSRIVCGGAPYALRQVVVVQVDPEAYAVTLVTFTDANGRWFAQYLSPDKSYAVLSDLPIARPISTLTVKADEIIDLGETEFDASACD